MRLPPAALLQVIALFPSRRDLLQDCQIRFRIAVLQEVLHADRREGCHDGGISLVIRKFDGGGASHPAAPRKPNDHRRDGADSYSLGDEFATRPAELKELAWLLAFRSRGTCAARTATDTGADGTRPERGSIAPTDGH